MGESSSDLEWGRVGPVTREGKTRGVEIRNSIKWKSRGDIPSKANTYIDISLILERGIQFIEKKKRKRKTGKSIARTQRPFHLKIVALRNKRKSTIQSTDYYEQFSTSNICAIYLIGCEYR